MWPGLWLGCGSVQGCLQTILVSTLIHHVLIRRHRPLSITWHWQPAQVSNRPIAYLRNSQKKKRRWTGAAKRTALRPSLTLTDPTSSLPSSPEPEPGPEPGPKPEPSSSLTWPECEPNYKLNLSLRLNLNLTRTCRLAHP